MIDYIRQGDCLELMQDIPDKSVDMILCDLPYGTTRNKWDSVIPFEPLWDSYRRIIKSNGAIVLFGAEPFTSLLICSNLPMFKYNWVWRKDKITGHLNAKRQPLRETETISVFYRRQCTYNPQLTDKPAENIRPPTTLRRNTADYGSMDKPSVREIPLDKSYPKTILNFRACFGDKGKSNHPTEKPVPLLEYLIKTYTNPGEVVLDNCMGSGSTIVAAVNTNRHYIGFELDPDYYQTAVKRIETAKNFTHGNEISIKRKEKS